MKLIKQHDERDCGAACLAMIAAHYGLEYPMQKYRELTKTSRNGTNLYGLVDAAKKTGLSGEALSGNIEDLISGIDGGQITLPLIAHIVSEDGMQHFVVVYAYKNGIVKVADPGRGKIKYSVQTFASLWSGYIVTFEKTGQFRPGNYRKGGFTKFFSLLKGQYGILAFILAFSIAISAIGIAGAFVFEIVIDEFYETNETETAHDYAHEVEEPEEESHSRIDTVTEFITENASHFNVFFLFVLGLYLLQAAIQFARGVLMSVLSKKIDLRLMLPYYEHLVDLPMESISSRNTGEYISRFSDASTIRTAVSGATLTLILDSIMVIACGVILYLENKTLFLVSLGMIMLYAVIIAIYRKPLAEKNREVMENNARVQSFLKESIDGIEAVKAHQAESFAKKSNAARFRRLIRSVFQNNLLSVSQDSLCDMIQLTGTVFILWVGFAMVMNGMITVGSLMTFYALLAYFTSPIKNLIELQPMMQTAVIAAERLNDILDSEVEKSGETGALDSFDKITLEHVDFRYGNRELTLQNVSFEIEKGEKLAIIGESGSGKTTLAKLLLRFYAPEKGVIRFGDHNISDVPIGSIRSSVAYVNQNTFLFSDTVKNNLLIANPTATDEELRHACRLAQADEFIRALPFGYDTRLDENGQNLSGGQRQRLAIARALLRKPKLLILDEATSHLDTITENAIKDMVFSLQEDLTCIVIAHRLNTIKSCDHILVLDKGTVVECGTHEELMEKQGYYAHLISK